MLGLVNEVGDSLTCQCLKLEVSVKCWGSVRVINSIRVISCVIVICIHYNNTINTKSQFPVRNSSANLW